MLIAAITAGYALFYDFDAGLQPPPEARMVTQDNVVIPLSSELRLQPLKPNELPKYVGYAVLASEARTHYDNWGISLRGMMRAAINDARGQSTEGGSAIEQQLAKNTALRGMPRFLRKFWDIPFSLAMAMRVDKSKTLRVYLDNVYFGSGARGIRAAAKICFGKPVAALSVGEGALLAASLPAPSRADCGRAAWVRKKARKIIKTMAELGWLNAAQARRASLPMPRKRGPATKASPVVDAIRRLAIKDIDKPIAVTVDARVQAIVARAASAELGALSKKVGAGIVVMRYDGGVANLWSRNYRAGGLDRSTQARLPAGSTLKIAALLTAIGGGMRLEDQVLDAPDGTGWPANDDHLYLGRLPLVSAFALSRNPPWPAIVRRFGFPAWARSMQMLGLPVPARPTPAMVLGTESYTLLQLAAAYASIANGAGPVKPRLLAASPEPSSPVPAAEVLCRALRHVVANGSGRAADTPVVDVAGKTGTTRGEALFIGIGGGYVVAVRIDRSDRPLGIHGGEAPARIARHIFEALFYAKLLAERRCGEPERGGASVTLPT